jgi:DNA-binding transcriptional MerR regulator
MAQHANPACRCAPEIRPSFASWPLEGRQPVAAERRPTALPDPGGRSISYVKVTAAACRFRLFRYQVHGAAAASIRRLGPVEGTDMTTMHIPAGDAAADNDNASGELIRIGDMAKEHGVTLRTLRFYEDKGLISPKRDGTTRLYSRRDRVKMKLILLGRKIGFSLRDVKQVMDLYDPEGNNVKQLRLALDKSEKQLARLHKQRQSIDEAIGDLSKIMTTVRQKLSERTLVPAGSAG